MQAHTYVDTQREYQLGECLVLLEEMINNTQREAFSQEEMMYEMCSIISDRYIVYFVKIPVRYKNRYTTENV